VRRGGLEVQERGVGTGQSLHDPRLEIQLTIVNRVIRHSLVRSCPAPYTRRHASGVVE
jgi:hypothetical protein